VRCHATKKATTADGVDGSIIHNENPRRFGSILHVHDEVALGFHSDEASAKPLIFNLNMVSITPIQLSAHYKGIDDETGGHKKPDSFWYDTYGWIADSRGRTALILS